MQSGYHYNWGWMWFNHPLILLLLVAVIVYLAFFRKAVPNHSEPSLDIAKQRYAQGEITRNEFEQIKKDILS